MPFEMLDRLVSVSFPCSNVLAGAVSKGPFPILQQSTFAEDAGSRVQNAECSFNKASRISFFCEFHHLYCV